MKTLSLILFDEWRFWRRSKVAATVLVIGVLLTLASVVVNHVETQHADAERRQLQQYSESQFMAQPDRHPHRMVHYGHYVFRNPTPLSALDPGVDAYTGHAIFLEGHRQNTAMFAEQNQSSGMTRFSSLSPAFLVQVLLPLLIVLVGYSCVTREKEAGTLTVLITQGVNARQLLSGKFLALVLAGVVMLLPLIVASLLAIGEGESVLTSSAFIAGYLGYIVIWSALVLWVSSMSQRSHASFAILISLWVVFAVLMPRIASSSAATLAPAMGKLETDFGVIEELRQLGDGHNAADPAFEKLKRDLLEQYQVDDIAELPVNFRGAVAAYSEEKLTKVLNRYAEDNMDKEQNQANIARRFGWLSPTVSMANLSMMLAGTNLETHHRFLRQAEELRFEFVQALNHVHLHDLDYQTDVNRYKDDATAKAARVDAHHWQVLSSFTFTPQAPNDRLAQSLRYALQMGLWLLILAGLIRFATRRLMS